MLLLLLLMLLLLLLLPLLLPLVLQCLLLVLLVVGCCECKVYLKNPGSCNNFGVEVRTFYERPDCPASP